MSIPFQGYSSVQHVTDHHHQGNYQVQLPPMAIPHHTQDDTSSGEEDYVGCQAGSETPKTEEDPDDDTRSALIAQTLNTDGTPKRPMNAFMIFARRRRPQVSSENQSMRTGEISKILSKEWQLMNSADKQFYMDQAKQLKDNFNKKYPNYVYRRRPNNSRKRRRNEGGVDRTDGLLDDPNGDISPTECEAHLNSSNGHALGPYTISTGAYGDRQRIVPVGPNGHSNYATYSMPPSTHFPPESHDSRTVTLYRQERSSSHHTPYDSHASPYHHNSRTLPPPAPSYTNDHSSTQHLPDNRDERYERERYSARERANPTGHREYYSSAPQPPLHNGNGGGSWSSSTNGGGSVGASGGLPTHSQPVPYNGRSNHAQGQSVASDASHSTSSSTSGTHYEGPSGTNLSSNRSGYSSASPYASPIPGPPLVNPPSYPSRSEGHSHGYQHQPSHTRGSPPSRELPALSHSHSPHSSHAYRLEGTSSLQAAPSPSTTSSYLSAEDRR